MSTSSTPFAPKLKDSVPNQYNDPMLPLPQVGRLRRSRGMPARHVPLEPALWTPKRPPWKSFQALSASLDPQEVINMQYTSGTTGFPKGVMLTHYNIVNNGKCIGDGMRFSHKDKLCITVPFFHCFGLVLALMASLTHATGIVPIDYFSPKR